MFTKFQIECMQEDIASMIATYRWIATRCTMCGDDLKHREVKFAEAIDLLDLMMLNEE